METTKQIMTDNEKLQADRLLRLFKYFKGETMKDSFKSDIGTLKMDLEIAKSLAITVFIQTK